MDIVGPRFPALINSTSLRIFVDVLLGGKRSLRADAQHMVSRLQPRLRQRGAFPTIGEHGTLVAVNHYHRPGFGAWWIALTIAAQFPAEMHWAITSAWTYTDVLRTSTLTPLTRWLFQRLASCYGLTTMPPMPSKRGEEMARARAVRAMLKHVRAAQKPLLGLAPEGMDAPSGTLIAPPQGTGRFINLLGQENLQLQPAGLYEAGGRLILCFGELREIPPQKGKPAQRDWATITWTMRAIASCLPIAMRGDYG
jgi:hypothetical protein